MPLDTAIEQGVRFARIEVTGHYDGTRHILLDNQVLNGRAGVHVLTPFRTTSGRVILVNRGWLPLGAARNVRPAIPTSTAETVLRGMLNSAPRPGRKLGEADKLTREGWPQLVTYLNIADVARSLQTPLENHIVQLSETESGGFEGRQWKPVFIGSDRHRAYAFQWFALMVSSFGLWVFLGIKRARESSQ